MLYYMSVKSKKTRRKSKSFQKRKNTRQTRKRSQSRRKRVRFNLKGGCGCEMTGGERERQRGGTALIPQDLTNMGRVGVHDVTTIWNGIEGISNVHNPSPLPEVQGQSLQL